MSDIANSAKVTVLWRSAIGLVLLISTGLVSGIFAYVKSADSKLTTTMTDVALIKFELPVIKEKAQMDKAEIQSRMSNIEHQMNLIREAGEGRNKEIQKLTLQHELLKQKLQLP